MAMLLSHQSIGEDNRSWIWSAEETQATTLAEGMHPLRSVISVKYARAAPNQPGCRLESAPS